MNRRRRILVVLVSLVIIFSLAFTWRFVRRGRLFSNPTYTNDRGALVAQWRIAAPFPLLVPTFRFFPVVGGGMDFRTFILSNGAWRDAPELRKGGGWGPHRGLRLNATVPTNEWKIEVQISSRREVRLGPVRYTLPWSSNSWSSPTLPALKDIRLPD